MLIGGNLKFKEFLESFDLQSENINSKYKTKAVKFYRENLDNIQYGRDREQQPNYEQGRELFEFQSKMGGGGIMAFGSDDLVQDERQVDSKFKQNWEKGKQTVSSWGMNIGRGFSSLVAKTKQKFESRKAEETTEEQEEQQPSKVKKTFSKGVTSLKSGMGTLGSKLSLGWSMFSSKTKEIAQDSKRFIESAKDKYMSSSSGGNQYSSGEQKNNEPERGMMEEEDSYRRTRPEYEVEHQHKKKAPQKEEEEVNYI